jgi:hypothetical protein
MREKKQEKNKKTLGAPPITHQDVNQDVSKKKQEKNKKISRGASNNSSITIIFIYNWGVRGFCLILESKI